MRYLNRLIMISLDDDSESAVNKHNALVEIVDELLISMEAKQLPELTIKLHESVEATVTKHLGG